MKFVINMMMGDKELEKTPPPGPEILALPPPSSVRTGDARLPPMELETAPPIRAFGLQITRDEERNE